MTEILETHGVKIPLDKGVITPKIERSIRKNRYELDEVSGTPKFIKSDDRVIELGAGIGFISSFLSVNLGVQNILCVEADPALCDFISDVHKLNGLSTAQVRNCIALNDAGQAGPVPFFVREQFWSSSMDSDSPYQKSIDVPGIHLSRLIQDFQANTLIVDIEGGERDLFSPVDLTGIDKVYLEVHTRKIKRIGIKQCFDALSDNGFAYDQQVSSGGSVLFRRIPRWQLKQHAG
ncbi:FkbM family methyltransferase [Roseobacter sp. EG26]|uniref:FkbM family methyltransferase n=1 Tax=Roseobacter sp. EG26 TaxID=3412477 RepID=UPI003CE57E20